MIDIKRNNKIPMYLQIYRKIRNDIISGQLLPGSKLDSIRTCSYALNVGVNTVKNAYNQLVVEGFVENKPKSGYFVLDIKKFQSKLPVPVETIYVSKEKIEEKNYKYDFTYQKMSMQLFNIGKWRRYNSEALLGYDIEKLGQYNQHKGEPDLRNEIKRYLKTSRNVHCELEQIIVCSGIQDSIERICRILKPVQVGLESPGLLLWKTIFESYGYQAKPLNVYPKYDYLNELYDSDIKIAVSTPSHQFPTGYTLTLEERFKFLEWGSKEDHFIIEDDYDCEFRYASQPLSAMQSLDKHDCVIYIGTFSKILLPGLRISYLVLPKKLLNRYDQVYQGYPGGISWLEQKTLYYFMCNDEFSKHIRKSRRCYKNKYYKLIHSCNTILGNNVEVIGTDAGLHILIKIKKADSTEKLIDLAAKKSVKVYSVNEYWDLKQEYPTNIILLGFTYINEKDIPKGIGLLKEAWDEYLT